MFFRIFRHADNLVCSVAIEEDYIVNVRTVAYELVFFQSGANEAFLPVDVEFLVGLYHLVGHNGVEILYFRQTRMLFSVFLLNGLEPVAGYLHHVAQFPVNLRHLFLDASDEFVGLVLVEFELTVFFFRSSSVVTVT